MDNSMEERLLSPEELNSSDLKRRVWNESKKLWVIAFPGMVARVSSFGMIIVTQLFMGHISELDLAAYGLQQSILLRFVDGILIGMSSATETLCGQAYGAGHYHMMGVYLQRSWIIDGVTATILLPLFIFTTPILRLIGQEENIAIEAGKISIWLIPVLYSYVFSLTIQMYLQAQQKNKIVGCFSAFSFLVHVLLSWLFVIKLGLGLTGAMGAFSISSWLLVIGEFVYIFGGWCPNTWKGFTKAAFADMLPLIKLSISSGVMICLELWYSSILVLLAGYMKNATIAISAFSICLNINGWEFMVCLGFLGSSCVRISNELGMGNAKAAKFSIKVALGTSIIIGIIFWVLCMVFSREISYLFTSSEEIAESVSRLHVLLAFSMLLNSIFPVLTGVAVGAGVQSMVAFVNLGSYYVIGLPVGILLGYVAHLQVTGLWIGLLSGVGVQTLLLSYLTWRIDWNEQVNKASERLGRFFIGTTEGSDENSNLA
ncbi:hypothetical protein POPTR_013G069400v4 [Populus trichocarpa]|uniref:Protein DETOXIFICATION n=1 Tax=Populus trichocarpa TaxID=3694 RepID=A0A3N7FX69_POPTR|nr:hypothetical protein POPTR_013G069400v4 [Populus trichocarpa]|eukprot:XP_002319741.3 protein DETOXIFICATION 24 [Populus trichocarpa]